MAPWSTQPLHLVTRDIVTTNFDSAALDKLRKSLAKSLALSRHWSSLERMSNFDLNELPYISQTRSLLLIVCASTFIIAPLAYMPLGRIQASYDQKCFLYTKVRLHKMTSSLTNLSTSYNIGLDDVRTEWGSVSICNITTFVPVMMSIFAVIIGLSTFTIWPMMMSLGRGGALMMTYTFLAIAGLVSCSISLSALHDGYNYTCETMREETISFKANGLSCVSLNNNDIIIMEVRNSRIVSNIHRAMVVAEIIGWCLVGLMISKIFICILTFLIIWFYINSR